MKKKDNEIRKIIGSDKYEFLLTKKYKFIEVVDAKNKLFYASDDAKKCQNGWLINEYGEKIGDCFLKETPSMTGIYFPTKMGDYETLPDKTYHGRLLDGRDCYFKVIDNEVYIWKIFTGLFIPKDNLDQFIEPRNSWGFGCLVVDAGDEERNMLRGLSTVQYKYLREHNLNKPATEAEKKKYGNRLHTIDAVIDCYMACYVSSKDESGRYVMSFCTDIEDIRETPPRSKIGKLPLVGWFVMLRDTAINDGDVRYARGCDGMFMSLIKFEDCATGGDSIIDLEGFSSADLTALYNYIEYDMRSDASGICEEQREKSRTILRRNIPFLMSVDYHGHTILPCNEVAADFLFIENDARKNNNKRIEKIAHEAYEFIVNSYKKYDYPHCLFVRFDGM